MKTRQWNKSEITFGCRGFKRDVYEERRTYLMAIPDEMSLNLPMEDRYDRIRYLRTEEGQKKINEIKRQQEIKTLSEAPKKPPKTIFNDW